MDDITKLDATALATAIRNREISPVDVVDATAALIERLNPSLLAFCTPTVETAHAHARDLERRLAAGEPFGPLAGVPVSIKDLIFTAGVRTTGGSTVYADFVPDEDDVCVERLRSADALMLGKTNVSELGFSLTGDNPVFGTTRNPWDTSRTSGGSSAGAAVAVATGMTPIGIGGDGGGSIRVPASFCGLFGFKPSMGRVPLYPGCRDQKLPGLSGWESLEHIGPLTRTVADAALAMSVIAGPDPRDRHSLPDSQEDWQSCLTADVKGKHIAYCRSWGGADVDPAIADIVVKAAASFETDLGCTVEEIDCDWSKLVPQFRALIVLDADLTAMRALVAQHGDRLSPPIVRLMGIDWTAEMFTNALTARKAVVNDMARLMSRYDYLLTPTSHVLPPAADKPEGADDIDRPLPTMTCIANMTGQPAASVPAGWTRDGLPVGLQIMGRHLADTDVLGLAAAFERAHSWHNRWPP